MCSSTSLLRWSLLLVVLLAGEAISASIKGGVNGTKSKSWGPPKDWDWSVTPGRLIPVSEATDDLPTPGYRMPQLQQRVPLHHDYKPFPYINAGSVSTESTQEEEVVLIGQAKLNSAVNLNRSESATAQAEEQSTLEYYNSRPPVVEQELILLNDEPIVYQSGSSSAEDSSETEQSDHRVPVVEEPMVKVELPEICSITGLGCSDRKPEIPQDSVEEEEIKSKVVQHTVDGNNTIEVSSTTERSGEQVTEVFMTTINEEQTTNHDQLSSGTFLVNEHVQLNISAGHSSDSQSGNNNNPGRTTFVYSHNETEVPEEQTTQVVQHFNFSIPDIVHSVVSSVEEYIGYKNKTSNEAESPTISKNSTAFALNDSQQIDEDEIQQQQEQQIQQELLGNHTNVFREEEKHHQYDEQTLLQIADSWGTSNKSNATSKGKLESEEKTSKEVLAEKVAEKKETTKPYSDVEFTHEYRNETQITDHRNSTESPTIGAKIETYWNAAKGYVSKALHL